MKAARGQRRLALPGAGGRLAGAARAGGRAGAGAETQTLLLLLSSLSSVSILIIVLYTIIIRLLFIVKPYVVVYYWAGACQPPLVTYYVLLHGARNLFLSLDSPTLGGLCGCAMSERYDDEVPASLFARGAVRLGSLELELLQRNGEVNVNYMCIYI